MADNEPVNDPAAVLAKNEQLLSEKRQLQARLTALEAAASAAGIDPANPAAFLEQRESATRAARERETKVRDAVTFRLLEAGVPVSPKVASGIIAAALADSSVTVDETGSASGAVAHADEWLKVLRAEPRKPAPGLPDTKARGSAESKTGPENFTQLVAEGPAAVTAFAERHPEAYQRLKQAHEQAVATPRRGYPTG